MRSFRGGSRDYVLTSPIISRERRWIQLMCTRGRWGCESILASLSMKRIQKSKNKEDGGCLNARWPPRTHPGTLMQAMGRAQKDGGLIFGVGVEVVETMF